MSHSDDLPIIEYSTAKQFEVWLENNHLDSNGLWVKIFKKNSGIKTITYKEALDVALCFGWIDSQKKSFDEKAWLQRFGPRAPRSIWSKINTEHIGRLMSEGKMRPAGINQIKQAKEDGRWEKAYDPPSKMTIPEDFLNELSKDKKAEEFFKKLSKTHLFTIGFRIRTAKKQETRDKRIQEIIEKLTRGEKPQ